MFWLHNNPDDEGGWYSIKIEDWMISENPTKTNPSHKGNCNNCEEAWACVDARKKYHLKWCVKKRGKK